jgi:hypothetical protein
MKLFSGPISRWQLLKLAFVFAFLLYPILYTLHPISADAATGAPQILNHQGRLLNASGTLLGGAGTPYCFRFSFYDDATPGGPDTKLWPTGSPTTTTATVRSGIFNVGIGDTSQGGDVLDFDFQSTDATYLNVDVAAQVGGACGGGDESFETLSPRQRIYSSGYAINANKLSGYTAAQTASGTQIPVLTSGNLVLGGTNPQVNATGTNALILQGGTGTGNIQFFNALNFVSATGTLMLGGQVTALNINQFLTTTSSPTFAGITVSGPAGLQSFTFSNATGTGNLEIATLQTTGAAALNSLTVSNVSGLAGVTFSNATGTGNIRSATLDTTGAAALNSLTVTNGSALQGITFTNATGTGNLQVATLNTTGAVSLNSLSVVGSSGLQGFTFTNATGTGNFQVATLNTTGAASLNSLSVTNGSALQGLTFTNATGTGNLQVGTLSVTGAMGLQDLTFANATGTGNLQVGTFVVTGASTLQGFTFTNATGTGNFQAASINNTPIGATTASTGRFTNATTTGTFTAQGAGRFENGLTVSNGATSLQGTTFTNATGSALRLSSGTETPLEITQSSSSQYFVQMVNESGIEQFRVDGNGSVFANGFVAKQMQFSEEFLRTNAAATNDVAGGGTTGLGDTFAWGVGSTGNGHVSVLPSTDVVNGAMQLRVTGGAARAGLLYLSAGAVNRNDILDADNKPVIVMKLRPTVVGANNLIFAGMADFTDGVLTDPTNGIYFTNASGTTWVGVARSGGAQSSVTCTGQTISTTIDAYFRIQVYSTSSVEFFMDNNTSNGIDTTSCGVVTSNIPTSVMTAEIMNEIRTGGTQPADVLIDYVRMNQDDPIVASSGGGGSPGPGEGADLAEEIHAFEPETTEPGDVLALYSDASTTVTKSSMPHEKNLYGVVTTDPGQILGNGYADSVRVALAGRIPVKVNLENGPIAIGDWLTSSNERGVAMKATRNGMVLGRALESFDGTVSGQNRILATVEVQYHGGFTGENTGIPTVSFTGDDSFLASVTYAVSDLAQLATRTVTDFVRVVADAVTAKVGEFVDLFARALTIVPGGTVAIPAGDNQMSGTGSIPALTFDVLVSNTKVTQASKIYVAPLGQTSAPLYIKEKVPGVGFRVGVMNAQESDVAFDWIIFDSYDPASLVGAAVVSEEASSGGADAPPEGVPALPAEEVAPSGENAPPSGDSSLLAEPESEQVTMPADVPPPVPEEDPPPPDDSSAPPDG